MVICGIDLRFRLIEKKDTKRTKTIEDEGKQQKKKTVYN